MNGFLTGSCRSSEISSMQWQNKCLLFKTCNPGRSFASDCGVSVASQKKGFKDVSRSWCFCRSSNDRVDLTHFFSDCRLQCWSRMRETLSIKQLFSTVTFISALFQIWMIYYSCSCYCAHCLCKVYCIWSSFKIWVVVILCGQANITFYPPFSSQVNIFKNQTSDRRLTGRQRHMNKSWFLKMFNFTLKSSA